MDGTVQCGRSVRLAPIVLGLIALDLVIYGQHAMFHAVPIFWRLHKVHHTDLDVDVTTGVRFHPAEVILSMVSRWRSCSSLGAPVLAVLLFEVILNCTSMFNHGNVTYGAASTDGLDFLS